MPWTRLLLHFFVLLVCYRLGLLWAGLNMSGHYLTIPNIPPTLKLGLPPSRCEDENQDPKEIGWSHVPRAEQHPSLGCHGLCIFFSKVHLSSAEYKPSIVADDYKSLSLAPNKSPRHHRGSLWLTQFCQNPLILAAKAGNQGTIHQSVARGRHAIEPD